MLLFFSRSVKPIPDECRHKSSQGIQFPSHVRNATTSQPRAHVYTPTRTHYPHMHIYDCRIVGLDTQGGGVEETRFLHAVPCRLCNPIIPPKAIHQADTLIAKLRLALNPRRFSTTQASRASRPIVTVTLGIGSANLGNAASVTTHTRNLISLSVITAAQRTTLSRVFLL